MPNVIDQNGLQVASLSEIDAALVAGMQAIYGMDINVGSNSPDGQMIGLFGQTSADILELLEQAYNGFAPDAAVGVVLDQRVALNGVTRKAGTYTVAQVAVTVGQALTLAGLYAAAPDAPVPQPGNAAIFTVRDDTGNQYQLIETHAFSGAGTTTLAFVCTALGQVETTANTIQSAVTSVLGVSSVNNPTTAGDVIGLPEETDAQLRIRRVRMFQLAAVGPSDAVQAALLEIADVADAYVVENDTNATVDGVAAHTLWCIVRGGTDAEIAQAIYAKRSSGCGLQGSVTYNVLRPQGDVFTAQWDTAAAERLYAKLTITAKTPSATFSADAIAAALHEALLYKINQAATIGDVVVAMNALFPDAICSSVGMSNDNASWHDILATSSKRNYFTLAAADVTVTIS